jgi:hypothetical protein
MSERFLRAKDPLARPPEGGVGFAPQLQFGRNELGLAGLRRYHR